MGSQLAGIIAAKLLKVPCLVHLRDFEEVHIVTKLYSRMINHHIAISTAIKKNLLEIGVPDNAITVVPDAIDINRFNTGSIKVNLKSEFGIRESEKVIGIFGRIVAWKGIKEFLLAAKEVTEIHPETKVLVVGSQSDGDLAYYQQCLDLVEQNNLQQNVIFTNYREDVPQIMHITDVIVHASIKPEPFGMVLIEGMAMNKPIVAIKSAGPMDIVIDGQTGFLVEMGNIRQMSKAIIQLLEDEELAKKMGQKGRERVRDYYCKERYADQMCLIYKTITQ